MIARAIDGKSGEVSFDKKKITVTVTANIIICGRFASDTLDKLYVNEANRMQRSAGATTKISDETYKVIFNITGEYREERAELNV